MKIDTRKKVRHVSGENIVIMQADGMADMTQVVALNESAMTLYNALKDKDFTVDDITRILLDTYDIDEETARHDAGEWVASMKAQGLVTD